MRAEALKGHLDGLLLATLDSGPRHGYGIAEALRSGSLGRVDLPTGTVYPDSRKVQMRGPRVRFRLRIANDLVYLDWLACGWSPLFHA